MAAATHRPAEAAQYLGIPASTLRRWSQQFGDFLSAETRSAQAEGGHRRYTAADLEMLAEVKRLLGAGLTYDQVREQLASLTAEQRSVPSGETAGTADDLAAPITPPHEAEAPPQAPFALALVAGEAEGESEPAASMGELLTNTLYSLSDSQQIILSNQQTSRQLLGVLLQDNFNLKEENSRLRERMLETERKLFELRQDLDAGQAKERERMRQMEQYLFDLQRRLDGLGATPARRSSAPSPSTAPAPLPPAATPPPAAAPNALPPPAAVPTPLPPDSLTPPPAVMVEADAPALPTQATEAATSAELAPAPSTPAKRPSLWERLWGGRRW